MYYWLALMMFFGGLVPLAISRKWIESKYGVMVLGAIAWVCGISLKGFINMVLSLWFPAFFVDIVPYTAIAVIVESTEILAAFLFLKYHPAFRKLKLHDLVGFAVGFGVGEALIGSAFSFIFVDVPFYGFISFASMVERWSAVVIHLASTVFIGLYVMEGKIKDFVSGLLIKNISAVSLAFPTIFALWLQGNWIIYMTELLIMVYATASFALVWYRAKGMKLGKAIADPEIRRKQLIVSATVFSLVALSYQFIAPYIAQDIVSATFMAVLYTFAVAVVFRFVATTNITELLLGAFVGFAVYDIFTYNLVALSAPAIILNSLGFALVGSSMIRLFGVMCAIYLVSALQKKKLKILS
jgi:hypothetical protein